MSTITDGLRTIEELDVEGRRVLLRADLNVPLIRDPIGTPVRVADDARIRAALPTIEELRRRGARLVLVSHLGRPSAPDPAKSMRPVAERLSALTGVPVQLAPAVVGRQARDLTERLAPGEMLMLENVRFEAGETRNDPRFASALAELADCYVDDAFASADRFHASIEGVAHRLPSAAGRLMEREVLALRAVVERPARPLVAILGGTKLRDKAGVVQRFLELADAVCVGGAIALPFLAARGHGAGNWLHANDGVELAGAMLNEPRFARLELPSDLQIGNDERQIVNVLEGVDVPAGWAALDIGPKTAGRYAAEIAAAATVFWNGPMGRVELAPFAAGTHAIAGALASTSATTVVSGGDTGRALQSDGLHDRVGHLSTGGRAALEFLEGRELPGVQALLRAPVTNGHRVASSQVAARPRAAQRRVQSRRTHDDASPPEQHALSGSTNLDQVHE